VKPIPINRAGLRDRRPGRIAWPVDAVQSTQVPPGLDGARRALLLQQALLLTSGMVGGAAIASALGVWPEIAASHLGLDRRGTFYLLVFGVYLVTTVFYAAWKSDLLQNLNRAPGDVRVMAYADMAVGGCIILIVGIGILAVVAVLMACASLAAWMLSRAVRRTED